LESDRSLFRAELLASSTTRQELVSIISLYKALGGGWLTEEEAATAAAQSESVPAEP
jgi:multidrug efflux system outer membrane protein